MVNKTICSPARLKCTPSSAAQKKELGGKIAVGDGIQAVGSGRIETERHRQGFAVDVERRPGYTAKRRSRPRGSQVGQPVFISSNGQKWR